MERKKSNNEKLFIKDEFGNLIEVRCTYDLTTKSGLSDRKVKGTIHWVSTEFNEKIIVNEYRNLYSEENPTSDAEINNYIISTTAIAELSIKNCAVSKAVQFMRNGYYTLDKDNTFIKTVSLKEGFKLI